MNFSVIVKLCFLLLLICERANLSRNLRSHNEEFLEDSLDDFLEKFLIDLDKGYLEKYDPRHIIVIGASSNDLQKSRYLFESYPHAICKETKKCHYSYHLSQGSFVIIFIEDSSEETFQKTIKIISRCEKCQVLFLSKKIIELEDIWLIFNFALHNKLRYSKFARLGRNTVELYTDSVTPNCSTEVRLATVWRPGIGLDEIRNWIFPSTEMNFHGCPISVSSLTFTPTMIISESPNGSLTIAGGPEGNLLLTVASELNFTIELRYPSMAKQLEFSRKVAIVSDVASGVSEVGIGRLRPTDSLNNTIAISFPYGDECITWAVPRVMKWSHDIVWVEFTWEVWATVGIVFTAGCAIGYVNRSIFTLRNPERKGGGFVTIVLNGVALHIGNPVIYGSSSAGGKFMFLVYLYYAMVLTTAYKTSLASILATDDATPTIVNARGIIDENLNVEGSLYDYDILKDQVNDSEVTAKLLERFVINNNDSSTWGKLFSHKNWAIMGRRSYMNYNRQLSLKTQNTVYFNALNDCILSYPTVMLFHTKSYLRRPTDNVIWRLVESGILDHWKIQQLDADQLLKRKSIEKYFEERATDKFLHVFILYCFCIAVSLLAFVIELLTSKLDSRKLHPSD